MVKLLFIFAFLFCILPIVACSHESISPSYSFSLSQPTIAQPTFTMSPMEDRNSNVIQGVILRPDGTIVNSKVPVFCTPVDPKVYLTPGDPSQAALSVESQGTYVIIGLPEGEYYLRAGGYFIGKKDRFLPSFSENVITVKVQNGFNTTQNIVLMPGGSITGRINGITPEMKQIGRFRILWHMIDPGSGPWGNGYYISYDDTYLLQNIPPGRIQLNVNNGLQNNSSHTEEAIVTVISGKQIQQNFLIKK